MDPTINFECPEGWEYRPGRTYYVKDERTKGGKLLLMCVSCGKKSTIDSSDHEDDCPHNWRVQ